MYSDTNSSVYGTCVARRIRKRSFGFGRENRIMLMCCLLTVVALVLAACSATKVSASTRTVSQAPGVTNSAIVLGTTTPLTGSAASVCSPISSGAAAWFKYINGMGGIDGRKIDDVVKDDRYNAVQALANATAFIGMPVFAMFGGCGTVQPPAIEPLLKSRGVPYLFPYAGIKALVEPAQKQYFSLMPTYGSQMVSLIKYVAHANGYGPGSVMLVQAEYSGEREDIAAAETAIKQMGMKYDGAKTVPVGDPNYTPVVLAMKSVNPTYVILDAGSTDEARIVEAMVGANWLPTKGILSVSNGATNSFMSTAGAYVNGKMLAFSPVVLPSAGGARSCDKALTDDGVRPGSFSLFGCGAAQVLTTALKEAGRKLTRSRLLDVLQSWSKKVASGVFPALTFSRVRHFGLSSGYLEAVRHDSLVVIGTTTVGP